MVGRKDVSTPIAATTPVRPTTPAKGGVQPTSRATAPGQAVAASTYGRSVSTARKAPVLQVETPQPYSSPRPLQRGSARDQVAASGETRPVMAAYPTPAVTPMAERVGMTPFSGTTHPSVLQRRERFPSGG